MLAQSTVPANSRSARTPIAPARLEDWGRGNSTFQAITGYYTENVSETSGELPEKITRAMVAPRFFQTWGVSPLLGRGFVPEEEHFRGRNAVVISDRLWRRLARLSSSRKQSAARRRDTAQRADFGLFVSMRVRRDAACGLLPVLRATRQSLAGSLAAAGRTQVSARNPLQWALG